MSKTLYRAVCLAAIAALPLAACGSDDEDSGSGDEAAGDAIVVNATGSLDFEPETIEAPAGEITFELVNDNPSLPHTFVIEDHEDDLKLSVGDSDTGSITLEEGEYVFYCDIPSHRSAGMEGTLTVGPAA